MSRTLHHNDVICHFKHFNFKNDVQKGYRSYILLHTQLITSIHHSDEIRLAELRNAIPNLIENSL